MIVYRYMSEEEFIKIVEGKIAETGNCFYNKGTSNTFKYKENIRYLHFFKALKDFPYIQAINKTGNRKFLCKFDIPLGILFLRAGKGYYVGKNVSAGYDYYVDSIKEFAVESSKMSEEFLVDFLYDEHNDLTVEQVKKEFGENKQKTENSISERQP